MRHLKAYLLYLREEFGVLCIITNLFVDLKRIHNSRSPHWIV